MLVNDQGYPIYKGRIGPIGSTAADFIANLRTSFSYKNFTFMALFDTRQGGQILNFNYWDMALNGTAEFTEARGTDFVFPGVNVNTGEPNTVPITRTQEYYLTYWWPVYENYVEDASYIKLRQITISYNFPATWLENTPLRGVKVAVTGRNLITWTDFSMGDPTGNTLGVGNAQGFYHGVTPTTRAVTFDVSISF